MTALTSVVMPVRNGADHVAIAIDSALSQLDVADEIIVIDDQSADGTPDAVRAIKDVRVKLIANSGRGVSAARNTGLGATTGQFVAFLDHDDDWVADRHRVLLHALSDNDEIDAVFGRMTVKFEVGAQPNERIAAMDGKHVGVAHLGTGLFRKRIIDLIGGFDETMSFGEDTDFFNRLIEAGMRMGNCDIDALIYRRHAFNVSNDLPGVAQGMADIIMRRLARRRAPQGGR